MANDLKPFGTVTSAWSTRPAAPVEGLETVGWLWEYAQYRTEDRGYYGYETVITENSPTEHVNPAEKLRNVRELVTRSQAEELLAAERADHEATRELLTAAVNDYNTAIEQRNMTIDDLARLEADNAALTARVKELSDERYKLAYVIAGGEDAPGYLDSLSVETLAEVARDNTRRWFAETDRAEALETQLAAAEKALERMVSEYDEVDLSHDEPPSMTSAVMEARAVLGGKPS